MKNREEEEMLVHVMKHGLVRWTDMVNEFERNRGWNHSKFVKHWKNIKPLFKKVPNSKTGRFMYGIKENFENFALKAFYRDEINQNDLHEIQIPVERFERVAELLTTNSFEILLQAAKRASEGIKKAKVQVEKETTEAETPEEGITDDFAEKSLLKSVGRTREKLLSEVLNERKKKTHLSRISEFLKPKDYSESQIELLSILFPLMIEKKLIEQRKKAELMKIFENVRIQLICSRGETVPQLTDEDISSVVNILISKAIDENKRTLRQKPFHLIASFPCRSK